MVSSTDDPLVAPDLVGIKGRSLNVSQASETRVAELSATGGMFKSGHAVLKKHDVAWSFEKLKVGRAKNANTLIELWSYQHLHTSQDVFLCCENIVPNYSVAWDAT